MSLDAVLIYNDEREKKIKDIDNYCINDGDPDNPLRQEIITGGLAIFDINLMSIGSFCEHENLYDISIVPKKINITLNVE